MAKKPNKRELLAVLKGRQAELRAIREEQQERAYETLLSLEAINKQIDEIEYEIVEDNKS